MMDQLISLSIRAASMEGGETFIFNVRLGDRVIASNQTLTAEQSLRVRELSQQYGKLFEQHMAPKATEEALAAIGCQLYEIWLAPFWKALTAKNTAGVSRQLLISSSEAEVLNLPWELLRPPGGDAIGADGKWALRRLPEAERSLDAAPKNLPPGPLRVLYMVAAPTDQTELDYEKEEELLLRSLSGAGQDVVFDSGDLGSFDELEQRIADFRPHLVHLTGHGIVRDGAGHFAFENEHGKTDLRPASEIGQKFAGQGVQCAFISACQAGKAPDRNAQNGLAQGLLQEGVPLVIGWTASILDDVATEVGARFYRDVANGRTSIDRALVAARQRARGLFAERSDPSWTLPVLYSATQQDHLFEPERTEARMRSSLRLEALPGMSEEGFTPHFIGRRRELQQLLPALRTGTIQAAILTGLGGAGKSTLATRLARKLEADGLIPIAISSSDDVPLSAAALLESCGDAFLAAGLAGAHARLRDPALETGERLRLLVNTLNDHRFVLVLDNFESNLDHISRGILDPEIAAFYKYLLARLQGKSRAIVTSRYLPADTPSRQAIREWQLGEFGEAAFLKFMLRDAAVETRYRNGELPHDLLVRLHDLLGGTPRFLGQIRKLLQTMPAEELQGELDKVALPTGADAEAPGPLQAIRDAYCEKIFTSRLFAALSPEAQRMLCRAAVLGLAVPADGLAAVSDLTVAEATAAAEAATHMTLLHHVPGRQSLWSVYGTLRSWLLAPARTTETERKSAHIAAGSYLEKLDHNNREEDLGINFVQCRQEIRAQYLAAQAWPEARKATVQLSTYFILRGLYDEVMRLNMELLSHEECADTLAWIGLALLRKAKYEESRTWYERSLALAQKADDYKSEAAAWHQLATIDLREGNYPAARANLERILAMHQKAINKSGEAGAWHQLAAIDMHEGDLLAAREKLQRSFEVGEQTEDLPIQAAALHQLASIDMAEKDYPAAREKLDRSLQFKQRMGDLAGVAGTWHQLGSIDIHEGHYPAARDKLGQALTIRKDIGDPSGEADALHQLATIDIKEKDYRAALEKLSSSLRIRQQIGERAGEAAAWYQLGHIAKALALQELAVKLISLCWIIDSSIGHGDAEKDLLAVASFCSEFKYTPEKAKELLNAAAEAYTTDRGLSLLLEFKKI